MAFPATPLDVLVEMAIGEDPGADPSTWSWTDITAYVLHREGIRIDRGKPNRFSDTPPSTLSLTVNNAGGRFVIRNPTGAYYPNLRRNVPIRVTAEGSVRFTGFVDTLPVSWDVSGVDPNVRLRAFGALKRLSRAAATILSAPRRYIPTTSPTVYWALEDGPLATAGGADVGTNRLVPWRGTHTSGAVVRTDTRWGEGRLGPWLPPVFSFPSANGLGILVGRVDMPGSPTQWTVHFMYAAGTGTEDLALDINPGYLTGSTGWPQLILNPAGREVQVAMNGEPEVSTEVPGLFDGLGHSVRLTAVQSGGNVAWIVYIDGVNVQQDITAGAMTLPPVETIGLVTDASAGAAIGHVAVWPSQPSNTTLASACLGWPEEPAGWRLERLCLDEFAIPFLAAGGGDFLAQHARLGDTQEMGAQPYASFIQIAREAEEVDDGILTEATTGELLYITGRYRYNRAVDLALDYDAGHVMPPFEPSDDDSDIRNEVVASKSGGARDAARYSDDAHIAAEGLYDEGVTLNVSDESQLLDQAAWRVHLGTVPELRYPALTLRLHGTPSLLADWLTCDIGSRVTIDNPPPELPPDLIDQHIVGYAETLTSFSWEVTANLAPASPYTVGIWEDSVLGRADTDGSRLGSAINASVTSISVETTAGQPWITTASHPSEFPFDIRVGGEVMRVTAITSASSPQTFTVTRGVNGVVTSHADEAPVMLANPMIAGL